MAETSSAAFAAPAVTSFYQVYSQLPKKGPVNRSESDRLARGIQRERQRTEILSAYGVSTRSCRKAFDKT